MAPKHPHTRAIQLAADDIAKVIASFQTGPEFMEDPASATTRARRQAIANAPSDVQALLGQGHTQEFVQRLAKLIQPQ